MLEVTSSPFISSTRKILTDEENTNQTFPICDMYNVVLKKIHLWKLKCQNNVHWADRKGILHSRYQWYKVMQWYIRKKCNSYHVFLRLQLGCSCETSQSSHKSCEINFHGDIWLCDVEQLLFLSLDLSWWFVFLWLVPENISAAWEGQRHQEIEVISLELQSHTKKLNVYYFYFYTNPEQIWPEFYSNIYPF